MCIIELTKLVRKSAVKRTKQQELKLLKDAKIIDDNGFYSKKFFSKSTVDKDKAKNNQ